MIRDNNLIKNIYRYVLSLKYIGDRYFCPICKGRFKKFLPVGLNLDILRKNNVIGGQYRENAVCPRCLSTDRERLICLFLDRKKIIADDQNSNVLHVAPEKNIEIKLRKINNVSYMSADINLSTADIKMDITNIDKDDGTYNVIICNHVLEHIIDDIKAMSELYRILKYDGIAILQVPISYKITKTIEDELIVLPKEREIFFGQEDHVRIYSAIDYEKRLSSVGFNVEAEKCSDIFSQSEILKYSLIQEERVFLCRKINNIETRCKNEGE